MILLEKRKKSLEKEGLFLASRKKAIPTFPEIIGIITSPTGAVIKDMLHRIEERFPTKILLWPVLVQGKEAAEQVAKAINGFNELETKPDVIIVARGGGSLEDLWPFNEEIVVRAAANSKIPLISAIGHETDTTLIDYAADKRAPTPTAAAEMVTPVKSDLLKLFAEFDLRLKSSIVRMLKDKNEKLVVASNFLNKGFRVFEDKIQKIDFLSQRLITCLPNLINQKEKKLVRLHLKDLNTVFSLLNMRLANLNNRSHKAYEAVISKNNYKLDLLSKLLDSYHYKKILQRGFALLKKDNKVIKSVKNLKIEETYILELSDGEKEVKII